MPNMMYSFSSISFLCFHRTKIEDTIHYGYRKCGTLVHECFPKHVRMGTTIIKYDTEAEEVGIKRRCNIERSQWARKIKKYRRRKCISGLASLRARHSPKQWKNYLTNLTYTNNPFTTPCGSCQLAPLFSMICIYPIYPIRLYLYILIIFYYNQNYIQIPRLQTLATRHQFTDQNYLQTNYVKDRHNCRNLFLKVK